MYCGNNKNNKELKNGSKVLGTRNQCLRKGVGIGMDMPYDPEYAYEYIPIDNFKIYCGDSKKLPSGYDRLGNQSQCLSKGVGIGKKIKANKK